MELNGKQTGMNPAKKRIGPTLEKTIEKHLGEKVRRLGCLFYKFSCPGHRGVPDRIIMMPNGHTIFAELKTDSGQPSPAQRYHVLVMSAHGVDARILYGMEDANRLADEIAAELEQQKHGV